MIVLSNFSEALQQYRRGVIPYCLLQEQAALLIGLCRYRDVDGFEITADDIRWLYGQQESRSAYKALLGGNVSVCQTEADILDVKGIDFEWPNVTDLPIPVVACFYNYEQDGDPRWATFLFRGSNGERFLYYIPRMLWKFARIEEHAGRTYRFWEFREGGMTGRSTSS